jgi:hypothetical protein
MILGQILVYDINEQGRQTAKHVETLEETATVV